MKMNFSPEEAHLKLYEKTRQHPHGFFASQPVLIYGEYYYFAEPVKRSAPFTGFFVNGITGAVEYRTSEIYLNGSQKYFPTDGFTSIEVIQ